MLNSKIKYYQKVSIKVYKTMQSRKKDLLSESKM